MSVRPAISAALATILGFEKSRKWIIRDGVTGISRSGSGAPIACGWKKSLGCLKRVLLPVSWGAGAYSNAMDARYRAGRTLRPDHPPRAAVFGTSMSAFTLVDSDRQWFKSSAGMESEEDPLETGFCPHAILESETSRGARARRGANAGAAPRPAPWSAARRS